MGEVTPNEESDDATGVSSRRTVLLAGFAFILLLDLFFRVRWDKETPVPSVHTAAPVVVPIVSPVLQAQRDQLMTAVTALDRSLAEQQEAVKVATERSDALHERVNQLIELEQTALLHSQPLPASAETNLSAILDEFLQSQRELNVLKDKAVALEASKRTLEESVIGSRLSDTQSQITNDQSRIQREAR